MGGDGGRRDENERSKINTELGKRRGVRVCARVLAHAHAIWHSIASLWVRQCSRFGDLFALVVGLATSSIGTSNEADPAIYSLRQRIGSAIYSLAGQL